MDPLIVLPWELILAQAIDAYPLEAGGLLIGRDNVCDSIVTYQVPKVRTRWEISSTDDNELRLLEWFGEDRIIGDWHTHPEWRATASPGDKSEALHSNTPFFGDGSYMLIVAIRPSKRKPGWIFSHSAYQLHEHRLKRVAVKRGY